MRAAALGFYLVTALAAEPAVELLRKRCAGCHGARTQLSGLRLDERTGALRVIVPGKANESKLMAMVSGAPGAKLMPPAGARLTASELELLRRWIEGGAPYPALVTKQDSAGRSVEVLPAPVRREWLRQPVDRFVLIALEDAGQLPQPEAARRAWARRVSFDLTGLPPADEELDDFLLDNRADAYERFAGRLLVNCQPRTGIWQQLMPGVPEPAQWQKPQDHRALVREIVLSAAYRQQRKPHLLSAAERRNALLAASGLLSPGTGKYGRSADGELNAEGEAEVLRAFTWRYERENVKDAERRARERMASDEFRVKE
jgi:hypothetical protein